MLSIELKEKFNQFDEFWTPKILGEFNGQLIKIAKLKGEFVWHNHENEDELFFIVKGQLLMKYRDQQILLKEGELHIVPKGVEHRPYAPKEAKIMIIEPRGVVNTGNKKDMLTAPNDAWI